MSAILAGIFYGMQTAQDGWRCFTFVIGDNAILVMASL